VKAEPGPVDWRHAPVRDPLPCVICGRPALLRHPVTGRACHKVCDDAQWTEENRP
jgi:hypothetical protein